MKDYKDCTDEELIQLYKDGDNFAVDFIFAKYKNIVIRKAKAMFLVGGDNDDLIQEGMIGMYKAIRDFDSTKEASFVTFASMCINRQMLSAVTASSRKKHSPLNSYVSLDAPVAGNGGNTNDNDNEGTSLKDILSRPSDLNPEELYFDQENADYIEEKLTTILSKYEQKVLELYMQSHNYVLVAAQLGKTPKSIDNALQRIRNKAAVIKK